MAIQNFECKARTIDLNKSESLLLGLHPKFIGEDYQSDTYFNVPKGRLKLRAGNIENALIYYERQDIEGAKKSDILLYKHSPDKTLKDILTTLHGIMVVVNKRRRIYRIENVKFHFDTITELGTFIEVEAIDETGIIGIEKLKEQCTAYAKVLNIQAGDYISISYSDMILKK